MGRRFPLGLTFKPSLALLTICYPSFNGFRHAYIYGLSLLLFYKNISLYLYTLSVFKNGSVRKKSSISVLIFLDESELVVFNLSYIEKWGKKSRSTMKNTKTNKELKRLFSFSRNKFLLLLNRYSIFVSPYVFFHMISEVRVVISIIIEDF